MVQYYWRKERERDFRVYCTSASGCAAEIVAEFTTKRAALAYIA